MQYFTDLSGLECVAFQTTHNSDVTVLWLITVWLILADTILISSIKIAFSDMYCLSFRMTNGGKSTLSRSLHQQIPNSCIIAQDSYFKVDCEAFFKSHHCFWHFSQFCRKFESLSDHSGCSFLQDDSVVPEDSRGFKQYDSKEPRKCNCVKYYCVKY